MYARPPKATDLETIRFEIDMLRFCYKRLTESREWEERGDEHVYLEAFLLHYRNLSAFFAGKGRGDELKVHQPVWANRPMIESELAGIKDEKPYRNYWSHISEY